MEDMDSLTDVSKADMATDSSKASLSKVAREMVVNRDTAQDDQAINALRTRTHPRAIKGHRTRMLLPANVRSSRTTSRSSVLAHPLVNGPRVITTAVLVRDSSLHQTRMDHRTDSLRDLKETEDHHRTSTTRPIRT